VVPGWVAIAAWLLAWIALGRTSLKLMASIRPGETVPMRWTGQGEPRWRVSPAVAAGFMQLLALLLGVVTITASVFLGGGKAPLANLIIAGLLVFLHWSQVRRAVQTLEKERG
jgi:hypothetical protein